VLDKSGIVADVVVIVQRWYGIIDGVVVSLRRE
jgi:hypothetical protein